MRYANIFSDVARNNVNTIYRTGFFKKNDTQITTYTQITLLLLGTCGPTPNAQVAAGGGARSGLN